MSTMPPSPPVETPPARPLAPSPVPEVLMWPAASFYWALLDASGVPLGRGPRQISASAVLALEQRLEHELPVPIDSVHAVYHRIDQRRVLAVAVPVDQLAAVPAGVSELCPQTVPEFLAVDQRVDPRELNLLTGAYEPPAMRRERSARTHAALLGVTLVSGLIAWGFLRRESAWSSAAAAAEASYADVARQLMPNPSIPVAKAHEGVKAELAELRQLAAAGRGGRGQADAAATLEGLLRGWPAEAAARADLVSITPTTAALTVGLDGDAQAFVSRLNAPEGWMLEPPQLSVTRSGTQLSLQFKPAGTRKEVAP